MVEEHEAALMHRFAVLFGFTNYWVVDYQEMR